MLLTAISIITIIKSNDEKEIKKDIKSYEVDKKHFSMFINDGKGNYSEYTSSNLFPPGYRLNLVESKCTDIKGNVIEGILSSLGNSITVTTNKTTYCYLYFDNSDDITINVTTNGTSGLPTINKYKAELTCNDATATYNNKYQRIEFSALTNTGSSCNLNYVNDTKTYTTLKSEVENKASNLGTAKIVLEDNSTFVPSSNLDYESYIDYYTPTDEEGNDSFLWDDANKKWILNSNYQWPWSAMSFSLNEEAYEICFSKTDENDVIFGNVYDDSDLLSFSDYLDTSEQCLFLDIPTYFNVSFEFEDSLNGNVSFYVRTGTYIEDKIFKEIEIGHRYQGKQPKNWVWFNNELWRIIGSIPTCMDSSCTTQTNLVKIIRAESIGGLSYHSSAENTTWGGNSEESTVNTLYTLLNSYYYGKQDATETSLCLGDNLSTYALCNYTNKGISNDSSDYYGRMVKSVYMNAGTVSNDSSKIDEAYTLETTTLARNATKVGLMTSSDYGFATSGITYSSVGLLSLSSYEQNNWIYGQGNEWTMTPNSTTSVIFVNDDGLINCHIANRGFAVRPVVYLNSSVYVISGTGDESNPYILGM